MNKEEVNTVHGFFGLSQSTHADSVHGEKSRLSRYFILLVIIIIFIIEIYINGH
jgi:hypothetical protein